MRTPRYKISDKNIDKSIEDLRVLLNTVSESFILNGVHIEVELANGVAKEFPHGLGRKYKNFLYGCVEGASSSGRIQRVSSSDDSKFIKIQADGWGATITVRLWVY